MTFHRVLFDVSGLVQWYAYLARPSGIQRVTESILGVPRLASHADVVFAARAIGSDNFYVVDPNIVAGLTAPGRRRDSIARLRRLFAQGMRLSHPSRLLDEMRALHLPYVGLGWTFTERFWASCSAGRLLGPAAPLRLIEPAEHFAAIVGLGDFWCHKGHVQALIGLKRRSRARLVHLVHDLIAVRHPQWTHPHYGREFLDQLTLLAPEIDQWLATSNHVAGEIAHYVAQQHLPARRPEIIAMGWPRPAAQGAETRHNEDEILRKYGLRRDGYMLHVGTVEPRKNLGTLFDALALLDRPPERIPLHCVLVGRDGWRSQELRRRLKSETPLQGTVIWLRGASDEELTALYRGARFTVLPSFDEGWGLPVQESLAHGTPCIASAAGGIPEAGLDLVEYVRAGSAAELAEAIHKYATDHSALDRARDRIRRRLDRSDLPGWQDSAARIARSLGLAPA